jgi:hypothetical protein
MTAEHDRLFRFSLLGLAVEAIYVVLIMLT